MSIQTQERPPRDGLIRANLPGLELRQAEADGGMPTLYGHFAKFDQWTEIDSFFEGHFVERIARGAFNKTFNENRSNIKVTFNHGQDPALGDKVLGPIAELREDNIGGYYEVPLLDTSYNRDLLPALEQGLYGASFKFRVTKETFEKDPGVSDYNTLGLPERTIQEVHLFEFGPVTYPAYEGATAGVRSMTDESIFAALATGEGLRRLHEFVKRTKEEPVETTPPPEPVRTTPVRNEPLRGATERPAWLL